MLNDDDEEEALHAARVCTQSKQRPCPYYPRTKAGREADGWSRGRSAGIINHASWMVSFRRVRRIWKELTVTDQIEVRWRRCLWLGSILLLAARSL